MDQGASERLFSELITYLEELMQPAKIRDEVVKGQTIIDEMKKNMDELKCLASLQYTLTSPTLALRYTRFLEQNFGKLM